MNQAEIDALIKKAQRRDTLKQFFDQTLDARVDRWCVVTPPSIVADSHFAAVSMECYSLYQDGYFYGAISLSQSVAEALVRFVCEKNGLKSDEKYWNNLKKLKTHGVGAPLTDLFKAIWEDRNDYHHLNPGIESDRQKLEAIAKTKLETLKTIEDTIFTYSVNDGKILPANPQYWSAGTSEGTLQVYLRID